MILGYSFAQLSVDDCAFLDLFDAGHFINLYLLVERIKNMSILNFNGSLQLHLTVDSNRLVPTNR